MFTIPVETASYSLFMFFLALVLVITSITMGIYWETLIDTFVPGRHALKNTLEPKA